MKRLSSYILAISGMFFMLNLHAQPSGQTNFKEKYRPRYHLTSKSGALFDPTALIYLNGQYVVNRGLAKSADLVHWQHFKHERLSNDTVREMSGSVVIDEKNTSGFGTNGKAPLVAIYSGLRVKDQRQYQCIAYSNDEGESWTPYQFNPVIDIQSTEFRDPQVFWYPDTQKWIMTVALAADRKIRFYESSNLKEWKFLSDFGPYGATNGVWECPDFFKLPVEGQPGSFKWVLEVSVQPINGQYFIGDFDGTTFRADDDFAMHPKPAVTPAGKVLFDFEAGLAGWRIEGDAFKLSPAAGSLKYQNAVLGFIGNKLVNSFHSRDDGTGKITSPQFVISDNFINFLIGGGYHENETCINLVIDNKVVRTKTGADTEVVYWKGWDVSEFKGKTAHLEIVDSKKGPFGHILVDHIMLAGQLAESPREGAYWLDYGPDFYAVRSWLNGPANDNRRISVAWLGSWLYATSVPTQPWKGGHTFPREVKLKKSSEGIRLLQTPVKEIEKLRTGHFTLPKQNLTKKLLLPFKPSFNSYELMAEFEISGDKDITIELCSDGTQKTVLSYNVEKQQLTVDRAKSGVTNFSPSFPGIYTAPLKLKGNILKLHILIDQSSVEVFGNDGEVNITFQIFPDPLAKQIVLQPGKGSGNVKLISLNAWELRSVFEPDK